MMTNIGKTKAEIILDLVLSMNRGDSLSAEIRVQYAERQYDEMVARKIIIEKPGYTPSTSVAVGNPSATFPFDTCTKEGL